MLNRAAFRGGGAGRGIRPPLLDVCLPLRFIVWLWHIEFTSPSMPGRLFCPPPPLKKILNAALLKRGVPLKCDGSHPLKLHIMFDSHDMKLSLKLILSSLVLLEHKGTGTHNYYHYQKILVYKLMHQLLQC